MSRVVLCLRPRADFERVAALPPPSLDVRYHGPADAAVRGLMAEAHALVIPAVGPVLSPALFARTAVRLVQVTGAGLDRLDRPTLQRLGIAVANVPGGSNRAVAEYAVAMATLLLRRFAWADAEIRRGGYAAARARMVADNLGGLDGLLVGIIGLGTIGMAVARAFAQTGSRICYFDPSPPDAARALGVEAEAVPLDRLLESADVVSLHVPLLPGTTNLLGEREMSRMKRGAVLIQASRGGVVDEAALARHVENGHLAGAAIDVYSSEPPAADNALFTLEGEAAGRLVFTPHIAGVTRQSAAFLCRSAWENVERVLVQGLPPWNRAY